MDSKNTEFFGSVRQTLSLGFQAWNVVQGPDYSDAVFKNKFLK